MISPEPSTIELTLQSAGSFAQALLLTGLVSPARAEPDAPEVSAAGSLVHVQLLGSTMLLQHAHAAFSVPIEWVAPDWAAEVLQMGRREVVELHIAASYICRPRNNQRGAKISEHGSGSLTDREQAILTKASQQYKSRK